MSKGRSNYYKNLEQNLAAVTQLDCKQTSHFLEVQCRATKFTLNCLLGEQSIEKNLIALHKNKMLHGT